MNAMPGRAPGRSLLGRVLDRLGIGTVAEPDGRAERQAEIELAQQRRARADRTAARWDRIEAEREQRGHLAWEDLLSPPGAAGREADRWN